MYVGRWVGVGACPAVGRVVATTQPDPVAAGSIVFIFDMKVQLW